MLNDCSTLLNNIWVQTMKDLQITHGKGWNQASFAKPTPGTKAQKKLDETRCRCCDHVKQLQSWWQQHNGVEEDWASLESLVELDMPGAGLMRM